MSLADDLKPLVDELRGLPGELGFRPYQVWVRKTTYAGPRHGLGTQSTTDTRLLVGGRDPKVRQVSRKKDIAAGTTELADVEFDIGPLTPEYAGGGVAEETLVADGRTTIEFLLKGPGLPASGLLCTRVGDLLDRPLRIIVRVKSTGRRG